MDDARHFLFLQGPHGPFFDRLGRVLRQAGVATTRIGFNRGDDLFWRHRPSYIGFEADLIDWPGTCARLMEERGITDLVLYGDTRPVHAAAIRIATWKGIRVHVFEEGYLRPYWISYERDGSNGHSRLMTMDVQQMRAALSAGRMADAEAPDRWGDLRQHVFWGAAYHALVMISNGRYRGFRPHRALDVRQEFRLYLRRLLMMPIHRLGRMIATARIRRGGFPYHLALLQLEHDSNFRAHSPFATTAEFIETVVAGFAAGAPADHHLVFKDHPLEDGRVPMPAFIRGAARRHGIADRVHHVRGGKLARLLDPARSAVTVNSTAAQQALWRGLPLKAFGAAVFSKPDFVSDQDLASFYADPARPDSEAYRCYRRFLLATSQVPGGFYSSAGRRQILRRIVPMMMADADPYAALLGPPMIPCNALPPIRSSVA